MKKLIILPLVTLILLGCSQPNTQQEADSKILQDEDLKPGSISSTRGRMW